ncbi:MAG: hypothetical protein JW750_04170, partial [Anaerolineaceae bacterium]|nr:hypothetical protein [Anaerolineaceae bacterium]
TIFMWKEYFMFLALVAAMSTMIPITNLLLTTPFFAPVAEKLPTGYIAKGKKWWIPAMINAAIACVTYPPLTGLSGIGGKMYAWFPFLKADMASGVFAWFLVNAVIATVFFIFFYSKQKKEGVTLYDMGLAFGQEKPKVSVGKILKTALLALCSLLFMYLLVALSQGLLNIEFRFLWPFMRTFNLQRFGLFWIYLIPALYFFLVNGGLFLFGQIRQPEYDSPTKTQIIWWLKNCFTALLGLVVVWAIQYLPYFLGFGPGMELLGLPQYSQMWPLMLFVFIPEFFILLFFTTWCYRRTGKVYLGTIMSASLAIWFSIAGTVISK